MKLIKPYIAIFCIALLAGCNATKYVSDEEYLLESVQIKSDTKGFDAAVLEPYIHQKANSKWFSLFKIPLGTYSLAGRDTSKWINRTLQRIGEEPVVFDPAQADLTMKDLRTAMQNMGYMHADVTLQTKIRGKKLSAIYTLHPGEPYYIHSVKYDIDDDTIAKILRADAARHPSYIYKGTRFTVDQLDGERKRITDVLMDSGYYRFHKDFIHFTADSAANSRDVNVELHLTKYRANNNSPVILHPRYHIAKVNFTHGEGSFVHLRPKVLENNTAIEAGSYFCESDLQRTYNNFAKLGAVKYTNITFDEHPDTTLLDCNILLTMNKPSTISFQPEGTNTAGDLGAAASLTYTNRNLFRGSELFTVELRGAFEAITGLEGYKDQDYQEYSIETKLAFPRILAPFLSKQFVKRSQATSELSLGWNLQNRPEFHRRVFSAGWRYRWNDWRRNISYRFDLVDLNYVYMPWISETFKNDYLDDETNRNAILRYNYEDLFIMKMGFGINYSDSRHALRANIESAGNLLGGLSHVAGFKKNDNGQYTLFDIAFAQYVKFDFDYTRLWKFDTHNTLAAHLGFGVAYPYGNSTILPFEKRYFSGGANSVRGWSVRELGPGKFKGKDGRIDFINQTGDMKLDFNLEYRTFLFWKFNGALFVDAGNIWTLRQYDEQPGGQFKLDEFYKQIAVAYGIGLRLNFDYFILRFDMGMKAINPAYESTREHYAIVHPDFSRDLSFHFAVGLPF